MSPYCASKFALEGFGICLQQELYLLHKFSQNPLISVSLIEPGAYATGFNQINIDKKYSWMSKNSYFKEYLDFIYKKEKIFWNFLEQKTFHSIIKKYVKSVEDEMPKFRYTAPLWQSFFIQIARILGK